MKNEIEYDRALVSYYELTEEWQAEARSNNDDYEEVTYIEPLDDQTPAIHCLLDLNECMRSDGIEYDGIIGISNNSAIGVNISQDGSYCKLTYL